MTPEPLLLAVDVGNTQTVFGLLRGTEVVEHWRVASDSRRTADELVVILHSLMSRSPVPAGSPGGIAVCSTVPPVLRELRLLCRRYYPDVPTLVVENGADAGIPVLLDNPLEVGSDRVVNAVATVDRYGGPAIVVDFGTATTYDAISASGEYLGGAIAPGIQISLDALTSRAAQLRRIEIRRPPAAIGRNTVDALRSGTVFAFAAQLDGMVARMASELAPHDPGSVAVVATGGLAPVVLDVSTSVTAHEPWLTLHGLALVYGRTHGQGRRSSPTS